MKDDIYKFNIIDKNINDKIIGCYNLTFNKLNKNQYDINNKANIIDDIKYDLIDPKNIINNKTHLELNFEIQGHSNIFGSNNHTNTKFTLKENKNINKTNFAHVVLYFPNYNKNKIKNDYLISTLLVGYLLKNMKQNYDLSTKNLKGTKAKTICMVTADVTQKIINLLSQYFDEIKLVPYIGFHNCILPDYIKTNPLYFIPIQDVTKNHTSNTHGYCKVFTKFNIFNKTLFPYEKIILIDSDLFPLGYYDTLFSLDAPAGWLEHRRQLLSTLGVSSWIHDREYLCKHGKEIPKMLTDIENSYASDINASLLVIEPNLDLYNDMICELQKPLELWFGIDKYHKGFWLGNYYYNYYLLPEQNYLTKRLSGQWKSIDLGFSSWSLDINSSFGFTFAGFVTKPWKIQSAFHRYNINKKSIFSQINNKISERAYACQLMNNLIYKLSVDNDLIKEELKKTKIIFDSFDPWEPQIDYKNGIKLINMKENNYKKLSYDQKKLLSLIVDNKYLDKLVYFDYIFDNVSKHIFNLDFIILTQKLIEIFYNIMKKYDLNDTMFPFGNTFVSSVLFGMCDITDDDSDFMIIVKNKNIIYDLIEELIKIDNIQVYIRLKNLNFIKISNNKSDMNFNNFKNDFDFDNILFFNFSFDLNFIENYISNNDIKINKTLLLPFNSHIKLPWVDIFFMFEENTTDKLKFLAGRELYLSKDIFFGDNNYIIDKINGLKFMMPNINKFVMEYYGSLDKLDYYVIKGLHNIDNRPVLFKVDLSGNIEKDIIREIYGYFEGVLREKFIKFK
jgi:hypothetical protein